MPLQFAMYLSHTWAANHQKYLTLSNLLPFSDNHSHYLESSPTISVLPPFKGKLKISLPVAQSGYFNP